MRGHRRRTDDRYRTRLRALLGACLLAGLVAGGVGVPALPAQEDHRDHDHGAAPADWVPEAVDMEATASEEARRYLNRGIEAVHNFWYAEARDAFREAQRLEPDFVLAYWGEAFSHHYPFGFSGGDPEALKAALDRLAPTPEARAALAPTERERRYLEAIETLAGEGGERERRRAFSRAMRELAEGYPDDEEAWAFYAISVFGTEQNIRGVPEARAEAARAAGRTLASSPRHPGGLHYTIHALDTPATAREALDEARIYATVSTEASHAVHMPSHIFLQLGMWDDAIAVNRRAFGASERWVAATGREPEERDYHAADFLHYALLQQGRVAEAHAWVEEMERRNAVTDHWSPDWYGALWAARQRVETEAWGSGPIPVSGFDQRDELTARGLDAVHTGDLAEAREILATMRGEIEEARGSGSATFPAPRWQVAAGELAGAIAAAEGRLDDARSALRDAFEAFDRLPPPNETPDPVKPPYELLGDILLAAGQATEAMAAYERQLELRAGRARSMIGLARAAAAAGRDDRARSAYRALLEAWSRADADRPELAEARRYLDVGG